MNESEKIRELEKEIDSIRDEFHAYILEQQKEESKKLKTALLATGGIILTLGGFLWWEVIWPAITIGRQ